MPIPLPKERIGKTFAEKYLIEGILGRGGMGIVYGAVHTWTSRAVALKILSPEYADDSTMAQRFLREAKAAASLKHPNVVDVLDMGRDEDGSVYMALELLDGCTLSDHIADFGPFDLQETLALLIPVMGALVAAHAQGIIHRDIKPDNIILAKGPFGTVVPKLLDFGIAKTRDTSTFATQTGAILGTPQYMSPEQASGSRDVGPATDVWALGMVIHECLRGEPPYAGDTLMAIISSIAGAPEPTIEDPAIHVDLRRAVERATRRDLDSRYSDMSAFLEALRQCLEHAGLEVPSPETFVRLTEVDRGKGSAYGTGEYELDFPADFGATSGVRASSRPRPMRSERPKGMASHLPSQPERDEGEPWTLELEEVERAKVGLAPGRHLSRPPAFGPGSRRRGRLSARFGRQPAWLVYSGAALGALLGLSALYGIGLSAYRIWMRSQGY